MAKNKRKLTIAKPAPASVYGLLPPLAPWLVEMGAFIPKDALGGKDDKTPHLAWYYQSGLVLPGGGRSAEFVVKTQALTVDVDLKLHPQMVERFGDAEAARDALYAMSQAEVLAIMDQLDFYSAAMANLHELGGLPLSPNRVVYTGHGAAFQYWMDDLTGLGPKAPRRMSNGWSTEEVRDISLYLTEVPGLWAWDPAAKSVGTRLSPFPGEPHRSCGRAGETPNGKTVTEVFKTSGGWSRHDEYLLTPEVLARMAALVAPIKRAASGPRADRNKPQPSAKPSSGSSTPVKRAYKIWRPEWDEDYSFESLGSHMPCPECGQATLWRIDNRYYCWHSSHNVVYSVLHVRGSEQDSGWPPFVVHAEVEFDGPHARWPSVEQFPDQAILAPRTGAGKTWIINRLKDDFLAGNDPKAPPNDQRRCIMICPTKRLAEATADRLGLPYSTPERKIDWMMGSFVTCFAGFLGLTSSITVSELRNTMFIVDEVEQCLKQLDGMIGSRKGIQLLQQLTYCVAYSRAVYLADAHAGPRTQLLLRQCQDSREAYGKTTARGFGRDLGSFSFVRYWSEPHRFDIKLLPTRNPDPESEEKFQHPAWKLVEQVVRELAQGQHVALICWKREDVDSIAEEISERMPDKTVAKIRGGETDEKRQDLTEEYLTRDLLIYNSAMASGVSVDVPNHYNVRALLTDAEVDGPGFEQMAHRVRSPATSSIIVAADGWVPISDWRSTPEGQDHRASTAWMAEVEAHGRSSSLFGGDAYLREVSTARFIDLVMLSRSESYREGRDWLAGWLQQHHHVEVVDLEGGQVYTDVVDRKKASRKTMGETHADAPLMSMDAFNRADKRSRKTDAEEASYQATRHANFYGREVWHKLPLKDRVDLIGDRKNMERARLWMGARFLASGRSDVLTWWASRMNQGHTKADASAIVAGSEIVSALYRSFEASPKQSTEQVIASWAPLRARAAALQDLLCQGAGTAPQQVQAVLAEAGVSIRKARKQEAYALNQQTADFMERVTVHKMRTLAREFAKASLETDESF
jgi:RNA polymerase-interacting CarD/CdnL/TRCF family regulator